MGCGMHGESFASCAISMRSLDMELILTIVSHFVLRSMNSVKCALYGIDEKDRCTNWKDGVYKPCHVGASDKSGNDASQSEKK